jgi:multisubunit Na+/H+ antiporter MnhB subunit
MVIALASGLLALAFTWEALRAPDWAERVKNSAIVFAGVAILGVILLRG